MLWCIYILTCVRKKLSYIFQGFGSFPFTVSALDAHTDLEWNPNGDFLRRYPIMVSDDGVLFYYRYCD